MTKTVKMSYREAMRAALREALQGDERVFLMGEVVGRYGGAGIERAGRDAFGNVTDE